jgi:hypothetical protein
VSLQALHLGWFRGLQEGEQVTAETESFKLVVFKTFPLSELERITYALKRLGYEGELADNGNVVFCKTGSPVMCSMNSNKLASECTCTRCTANRTVIDEAANVNDKLFDAELFVKVQKAQEETRRALENDKAVWIPCDVCKGKGVIPKQTAIGRLNEICKKCGGKGTVKEEPK